MAMAVAATCVALAVAEWVCQLLPTTAAKSPSDLTGFTVATSADLKEGEYTVLLPSGATTYEVNRFGYRGDDYEIHKTTDFRIVCLGDSTTFASECPRGTTYPARLQLSLDEQYGAETFEVLNQGLPGNKMEDLARQFEDEVVDLQADLVTVCAGFNDLFPSPRLDLRPGQGSWLARRLYGRSALYTILHNQFSTAVAARASTLSAVEEGYVNSLRELRRAAEDADVRVLLLPQPMLPSHLIDPDWEGDLEWTSNKADCGSPVDCAAHITSQHAALMLALEEFAREHDVPYVDPRRPLFSSPDPAAFFSVAMHLDPGGSELFAGEIVRLVDERYGGFAELITAPPG